MQKFAADILVIFFVFAVIAHNAAALNILTGGKSHLDFNDPHQDPETPPPRFFASSTVTPKQRRTSTSRVTRSAERIALGSELASSFARNVSRIRFDPTLVRPETINQFPPMFARLLASLSTNTRKVLDIDAARGKNIHQFEGDATYRKKRQAISVSVTSESSTCQRIQPACLDFPFDALVPHDDMILAFKNGKAHMIAPNGSAIAGDPVDVQDIFPNARSNITAALRMKDHIYLFFGSTYMKFRPLRRAIASPEPLQISSGFHGVPVPVEGAFQLNHHTYVFLSGPKFVFYQPDAVPPVNPKYSPNLLANIAEGPKNITGVFNTPDGRRFMLGDDQLYELNDKMKVIKVQKSTRQADDSGWLDCIPKSSPCANTTVTIQNSRPGFQVAFPDPSNSSTVEFPSGTVIVGSASVPRAPQSNKANTGENSPSATPAEVTFGEMSAARPKEKGTAEVPADAVSVVQPAASAKTPKSAEEEKQKEGKQVSNLFDDTDDVDEAKTSSPSVIHLKPPTVTRKPQVVLSVNGTNVAQQLEEQQQVLKMLVRQLDTLTHAISAIPVVPQSRVLKDLK